MPINLTVKIVDIDVYGFVGREHHPSLDMKGHLATVFKMHTLGPDSHELHDIFNIIGAKPNEIFFAYDCLTDDGRVVTLMDFEVEPYFVSESQPLPIGPAVRAHAAAYFRGLYQREPVPAGW